MPVLVLTVDDGVAGGKVDLLKPVDGEQRATRATPESLQPQLPESTVAGRAPTTGTGAPVPQSASQVLSYLPQTNVWVFDGVNDSIGIGDFLDFDTNDPFSIGVWFSTASLRRQDLVAKDDPALDARGYATFVDETGALFFNLCNDNAPVGTSLLSVRTPPGFADGTEHFVLFRYSGSALPAGVRINVDDIVQALTTVSNTLVGTTVSAALLTIGAALNATLQFFGPGTIRHVSIWNANISDAAATAAYAGGSPPNLLTNPAASNLVGWWPIDASDTVGAGGIRDLNPNVVHNGTAQGGLAPSSPIGGMPVRATTGTPVDGGAWNEVLPGPAGYSWTSNGPNEQPSWQLASAPPNVYKPAELEDFDGGADAVAGVALGTIGSTGWSAAFTGGAGTVARVAAAQSTTGLGFYRVTGGGANGNQQAIYKGNASNAPMIDARRIKRIEWNFRVQWTAAQAMEVRCGVGSDPTAASSGNEGVLFVQDPAVFPNTTVFIARGGGVNETVDTLLPSNNATPLAFRFALGFNLTTNLFEWEVQRTGSEILRGTHPTLARAASGLVQPFAMTITQGGTKLFDADYCSIEMFQISRGL